MIEFATLPIGSTLSDFFDVNDIIGEGSFGIVYRAVCRMTGLPVAIKEHKPSPKNPSQAPRDVLRELLVHGTCESPYLVKLLKVVTNVDSSLIYLIYERMDYDLSQLIRSFAVPPSDGAQQCAVSTSSKVPVFTPNQPLSASNFSNIPRNSGKMPLQMIRSVMWQILNGVFEMHDHNLIHRDLKPANILVKDLFARCAAIGSASQQPTTTSTPLTTTSKRDPPSTTTNDTNPSYPSTSRHRKRPRTTASSASPRNSTHDRESVCSRDVSTASMFTDVTPSAPRGAKQQTGDGQQTLLNPAEIATVAEDSRDGRANTTWQSDKRLKTSASDNTNPIAESTTERISQSPVKHAEERALNRDVSDSSSSLLDCKCGSQDCFKHIVLITEYPAQSKKTAVCQQLMYGGEKNVVPLGYMSIQLRSQHEISTHMAAKQRNHPLPPTATSHTATSLPPTHLLASSLSATILSAASLSPADISCHPLLRALQRQGFDPTQCILMSASPALSHTHVRRFADFSMTSCPLTGQSSSFPLTGPGQSPLTGHPSSSSLAGPSSHLASTDLVSSSSVVSPSLAVLEHGSVVLADMGMAIAAKHGVVEPLKQREGDIMTLWYRAPELILGSPSYTNKIDIWGTGCIFLECLLLSCPFQGKEVKQEYQKSQFQAICNLLGNPEFSKPGILRQSRWYVTALQELKLSTTCAALDDVVCGIISGPEQATCLDLLLKLLTFNPEKRISALEALQHPFFDSCRSFYVSPNASSSAPHVKARTKDRGTHETISLSLPDPNNLFCLGASLAKGNDSSTETLGSRAPGSEQDKSAVAGEHEVWVHVPIKYRRRRHREKKVVSSSNK